MKEVTLGQSELKVSQLAYGCMRIAGTWNPTEVTPIREDSAMTALRSAYENGYTFFDHADIYCRGVCEAIHGKLLRDSPTLRRSTVIATKCGIREGRYDFSKQWILESCDASLIRLGVEVIDLYQLHRPDVLMDPEEVEDAFDCLKQSGKVRTFGVSNFSTSQLSMLQSGLGHKLIVNQIEVSLARLDPFVDGTLDQCIMEKVSPLSWSPIGGGSVFSPGAISDVLKSLADQYMVSSYGIALAWLMSHPSKILPIVGTTQKSRILDATVATTIHLSREDWYKLYVAARGEPMP